MSFSPARIPGDKLILSAARTNCLTSAGAHDRGTRSKSGMDAKVPTVTRVIKEIDG